VFRTRRALAVFAALGAATAGLAACGGDDDDNGGGGGDGPGTSEVTGEAFTMGTTDYDVTATDPAGSYDLASSFLHYQIYETLLTVPAGSNEIAGDAAESCEYEDPQNPVTLTCTLRDGLTFSNGDELTSSDVKFSLERNIAIADPDGASGLLASVAAPGPEEGTFKVDPNAIETPDPQTVVFHLNHPDVTFQYILTHSSTSIVNEDVFPEDEILPDDQAIGSGPYTLEEFTNKDIAVLAANPEYSGERKSKVPQVFVNYYQKTSTMKDALENGEIQLAYRSFSPTETEDLRGNDDVEVIDGEGAEIRYWVWDLDNDVPKNEAIRKAVAQIIDRDAIAERAYGNTVEPLYSIVPPGFPGQTDAFEAVYGEPNVQAAEQLLNDAGVETPVELTMAYTGNHYGPNAVDEATELQRQLEDSGLFTINLENAEWEQYQGLYDENAYDLFQLGWFPDFPDADNYLSPFIVDGGFYSNGYSNDQVNQLITEEQSTDDPALREDTFRKLQEITAQDVPMVPSWVGKNTAVITPGIEGVEDTLDPAHIFRLWMITYNP
jgi:peptide/nickel transport system substrate-binding protein